MKKYSKIHWGLTIKYVRTFSIIFDTLLPQQLLEFNFIKVHHNLLIWKSKYAPFSNLYWKTSDVITPVCKAVPNYHLLCLCPKLYKKKLQEPKNTGFSEIKLLTSSFVRPQISLMSSRVCNLANFSLSWTRTNNFQARAKWVYHLTSIAKRNK